MEKKIHIHVLPTDAEFMLLGHTFHGLRDLSDAVEVYAKVAAYCGGGRWINRTTPKNTIDGIHVLELYESYPCFDSSDFAYEDRTYQNYFISNREFTDERINRLAGMKRLTNYQLAHEDTSEDCLPAVYYRGDGQEMFVVTTQTL